MSLQKAARSYSVSWAYLYICFSSKLIELEIHQNPEIQKQNRELQQTFRQFVRGYPTVLIFKIERTYTSDGKKDKDNIQIKVTFWWHFQCILIIFFDNLKCNIKILFW